MFDRRKKKLTSLIIPLSYFRICGLIRTVLKYGFSNNVMSVRWNQHKKQTKEINNILYSHSENVAGFSVWRRAIDAIRAQNNVSISCKSENIVGHISKMNNSPPQTVGHNMIARHGAEANNNYDHTTTTTTPNETSSGFKSYCRALHNVLHHPIGTCSMLPRVCVCVCVCEHVCELLHMFACICRCVCSHPSGVARARSECVRAREEKSILKRK